MSWVFKRQNDLAAKEGRHILSAYEVPIEKDETERIWHIAEADRSATTLLRPAETGGVLLTLKKVTMRLIEIEMSSFNWWPGGVIIGTAEKWD